jgi:hypothetical protein
VNSRVILATRIIRRARYASISDEAVDAAIRSIIDNISPDELARAHQLAEANNGGVNADASDTR